MLFVFSRLYIDVVQLHSKFAGCHFAEKKLSSGRHKVALTENRTVVLIPTSRLGGGHTSLLLPRAPKTLDTPLRHE